MVVYVLHCSPSPCLRRTARSALQNLYLSALARYWSARPALLCRSHSKRRLARAGPLDISDMVSASRPVSRVRISRAQKEDLASFHNWRRKAGVPCVATDDSRAGMPGTRTTRWSAGPAPQDPRRTAAPHPHRRALPALLLARLHSGRSGPATAPPPARPVGCPCASVLVPRDCAHAVRGARARGKEGRWGP